MTKEINYDKWSIFTTLYGDAYPNATPTIKAHMWADVEDIYNKLVDKTEDEEALEEETNPKPQLLNE